MVEGEDIPEKPSVTATVVYFIKGFLWRFWISNCNLLGWKVAWKNNIWCIQGPERKFLCILEMVTIHWEMLMQLLCFLVSMPTCWACSQRRLVYSSDILVFGPEVSLAAIYWNCWGPHPITFTSLLSCRCHRALLTAAPWLSVPGCSLLLCSHSTVTPLLFVYSLHFGWLIGVTKHF